MDILEQYKKEHPEAFREQQGWQPPAEYGFFIRLVMKLSKGKVRDVNRASFILFIAAGLIVVIALVLIVVSSQDTRPHPTTRDLLLTPPSGPVR